MREINAMGLRTVGITIALLVVLFGLYWGGKALLFNKEGDKYATTQQEQSLADRTRDSDGDGVTDLIESVYYQTDPNNADTDGDGMPDGEEIIAGRDPLIPGPDDESKPATGSKVTQQITYTQKYLASLPDNVARDKILDQTQLESFVNANRGELLPTVTTDMLSVVPEEGKEAISVYLNNISSAHNDSLKVITSADIEAAFRLLTTSNTPQPMQDILVALINNVAVLEEVSVPTEVTGLHARFLAASQALRNSVGLLSKVNQDFVGSLIAAKNIEDLGDVFQEVAADILALEEKYGID